MNQAHDFFHRPFAVTDGFPSQMSCNVESVSMSFCQNGIMCEAAILVVWCPTSAPAVQESRHLLAGWESTIWSCNVEGSSPIFWQVARDGGY